MTLLPHENRAVTGLAGAAFPEYKVGPVCCNPGCSRYADHAHHLWRRSALGGPYAWVELWDHTIVGNLVPLCWRCHQLVTEGKVWMRYEEKDKVVVWDDNTQKYPPRIFPALPVHGAPLVSDHTTRVLLEGPAAGRICPGCHRVIPRKREEGEELEAPRRRKTWTISVPDDGEDGALVLDELTSLCRDLFHHSEDKNVRYFTVVQALALVVQHGHALLSDGDEEVAKST